ncbi:hypothetical protein [Paenibacillus sp. FSL R5-0914]|uniref:hypothetical protein n=1 Tax=Paenibacillus sp. FSL R5-0914 TaxID=2921665 RepID=UPI0030F97CA0
MDSNGRFHSQRIGFERPKLSLVDLNDVFKVILDKLEKEKHFTIFYGEDIGFQGWTPGIVGNNFEAYCLSEIGRRIKSPFHQEKLKYKEVDLFDLIELLYSNIQLESRSALMEHTILNSTEAKEYSKSIFRTQINNQLSRYDLGWELTHEGYIRELVTAEFRDLVDNPIQSGHEERVDSFIRRGIKNFLEYGATQEDKKSALVEIGNGLEFIRKELEKQMPAAEDDIFHLLNKFYLRHNNKNQNVDYDTEIYYPWMFYTYISTFDAYVKLIQRQ